MAENVENMVLIQLREMREEMRSGFETVNKRLDVLEDSLETLETKIDGNSVILINFGANIHNLDERVGHIEEKLGIEQ